MATRRAKATKQVVEEAYHGTDLTIAKRIEKGEKFRWNPRRENENELFLGNGTYFFEGSMEWAISWAKPRYRRYGVLCATVRLGTCLDLNTQEGLKIIDLVRDLMSVKLLVPKSRIRLAAAVTYYVENIDKRLDTIRATNAKAHRGPVFPGRIPLYICELIICVRNVDNISNVVLVEEGVGNG